MIKPYWQNMFLDIRIPEPLSAKISKDDEIEMYPYGNNPVYTFGIRPVLFSVYWT